MRWSPRILAAAALTAFALWPLLLVGVHEAAPVTAVALAQAAELWGARFGLGAGVSGALLAMLWPPFLPGVRLWWQRVRNRLRQDPARLHAALVGLQHLDTASGRLEAARLLLDAGRAAEACDHAAAAVRLAPDLTSARYLLGQTLLRLRRPAQAAEVLAQVVAAEPGHAFGEAMHLLGAALLKSDRHADALAVLQRHEREHGATRLSRYRMALAHRRLGDQPAAREALREAAAPARQGERLSAADALARARARGALWTWGRSG